jgi:isoleucyl-tRNA synthetase
MYTFAPSSHERRSAQTVLWKITEALVRLVAPILSFTADEVWEYLPVVEGREASVHLALFPKPEEVFSENPLETLDAWKQMFGFRNRALIEIEDLRKNKVIGKALEVRVEIWLHHRPLPTNLSGTFAEILNVSEVEIRHVDFNTFSERFPEDVARLGDFLDPQNPPILEKLIALPAAGTKCKRCWRYTNDTTNYGSWQDVCKRCRSALKEMGIDPPQAEDAA